jgi:hypothetical protein
VITEATATEAAATEARRSNDGETDDVAASPHSRSNIPSFGVVCRSANKTDGPTALRGDELMPMPMLMPRLKLVKAEHIVHPTRKIQSLVVVKRNILGIIVFCSH